MESDSISDEQRAEYEAKVKSLMDKHRQEDQQIAAKAD